MISFDEGICRNLDTSSQREWLETNGLGGFASSTIAGLNTRRYHGLLVAATKPPVGRMVLLSKFEETLIIDGRRYELSANRYPGTVHPQGYRYLKQFRRDPFPVFVYQVEGCEFEKTLFMAYGENSTVIQYALRSPGGAKCSLELRPLIAFRDYHTIARENAALNPGLDIQTGAVKIAPYQGLPPLCISHTAAEVSPAGCWYRNFEYEVERARGLDYQEDLFNPFVLTFDLNEDPCPALIASTEQRPIHCAGIMRETEIRRRQEIEATIPTEDRFARSLAAAADQFVVKRGNHSTVIAGYHWFSDWGRDTMIALAGLTLATGRPEVARSILLAFTGPVNRGMLPNRFPDDGEIPEYNTVDATLWFFEAVRAFVAHTGDHDFVRRNLYDVMAGIISWHERGTRFGIRVDSDGLLSAGAPGVQLTWMDAKMGDWVVTPRQGKPVEIEALWYNALRIMEELAAAYGREDDREDYHALAAQARRSFCELFWNESEHCLYDVVDGELRDASIRPNQILAVSLHHQMLPAKQAKSVVAVVKRHLLTPYGLRTLAPGDPQYRGKYEGDLASRDGSYHQGTVWPWLLGPFIRAYLRVNGGSRAAKDRAAGWIARLRRYSENEGVGQIPEIFDGDAPHRAAGCLAQAWSVAELLRVWVEDLHATARPKPKRSRAAAR